MNNWFTVKVKYTKQLENGTFKRVSEPYLLAAMTFTDAEAKIYEELGSVIRGEFIVTNIARTEYHDIFHYEDSDTWYKCKMSYVAEDADSEKKKKVSQNFLVTAHSVKEAYERLQENLQSLMADYDIPSITSTPIVDIFPFREEMDKEISRRPMTEEEEESYQEGKGVVFSASGSDVDDEDEEEELEEADSELEDDFEN
ncbi:MAG: DUF4494 domain-containing protein [Bacteroidetes bacterium]|nr:MAG: DUF4494 domain-containing protein [Bacteroidota bacterium]